MRGQETGFTIIELTLFLAISGLLLLAMFLGTGSIASNQRFTDSTDSLQSYIQTQYDEVVNGVNARDINTECPGDTSAAGMSQKCLLLGKLITISSTEMKSQYVISTSRLTGAETDDKARLVNATLKVADDQSSIYEIKWGATAYKATRSTGGPSRSEVDSIAFLRMPDSGRIVQLYYYAGGGAPTDSLKNAVQNVPGAYNPPGKGLASPSLAVCLKNTNDFIATQVPKSAISFGQGGGSASILTDYQPGGSLCP